jgi:hypothetical protein
VSCSDNLCQPVPGAAAAPRVDRRSCCCRGKHTAGSEGITSCRHLRGRSAYPNSFIPLTVDDDAKALAYLRDVRPFDASSQHAEFIAANKLKQPGARALIWAQCIYPGGRAVFS